MRWLLCLCALLPSLALADVTQGNDAFWKGDFDAAAQAYRAATTAHPASADLWFNLGTAEANAGRLGPALHALEQAHLLNPADEDATFNLNAVRQQAISQAMKSAGDEKITLPGDDDLGTGLLTAVSPTLLATVFGVFWVLLFVLLAIWKRTESSSRRTAASFGAVIAALVAIGAGGLLAGRANMEATQTFGVVIVERGRARIGPGEQYKAGSIVVGGVKVRLRGADSGWRQVVLPDGSDGWLREAELAALVHP
jgi:tetratricopeptide (TPR) repeat protein